MTDLEMIRRCAEKMGIDVWECQTTAGLMFSKKEYPPNEWLENKTFIYNPLRHDAQAMALVKKFSLCLNCATPKNELEWEAWYGSDDAVELSVGREQHQPCHSYMRSEDAMTDSPPYFRPLTETLMPQNPPPLPRTARIVRPLGTEYFSAAVEEAVRKRKGLPPNVVQLRRKRKEERFLAFMQNHPGERTIFGWTTLFDNGAKSTIASYLQRLQAADLIKSRKGSNGVLWSAK